MTVLLLFSSLTHFLQGSGQRTGMAIAEAWFCAQWPIFVLFLRFVFGLLYGWKIQTWPIISFLTESVTCWFFYLLVFDRIHDAMCLNKMSRTSCRNIGTQHHKYSSIFHCTHGVLFIPLFTKPILSVCCWKAHFFCFIWPKKPVPFKVPVVSDSWICWSLFLDELGYFFLKPSRTTCDIRAVWPFFLKVF